MGKGKVFYGWWIVLVGFILMSFLFAPISNLVSLFVVPVTEELGIGRTQFTTYFTIMALVSMVMSPIVGHLMKKLDVRLFMSITTLLGAGAFLGFSFATQIIHFYVFAILMGIAMAGTTIPVSVLITNWFNTKRGLCLGIALAGSGVGSMILSPITNWLIIDYGWRVAYQAIAISIVILIIPLVIFIVRLEPADKGLLPFGEIASTTGGEKLLAGVTQREAFRTLSFWLLCAGILVGGIVVNSMIVNLVPYLTDIGTPAERAALLMSLSALMVIIAKLLVGRLYDKIGLIQTLAFIVASDIICFLLLFKGNLLIPGILYTVFAALGSTAVTVTPAYLAAALFGEKEYSMKYGTISLFTALGAALAPIVSGLIYNVNYSYTLLIQLLIALAIIEFVLFYIAIKMKPTFDPPLATNIHECPQVNTQQSHG